MRHPLPNIAALFAALLGTAHLASGQQGPGSRPVAPVAAPAASRTTGRITGTVTDAVTGKPVSYATVAVLDGASGKVVNGGVCGDDGKFVLPGIPAGSYTVQVSFLGYKNEERTGVAVPTGGSVDLGAITLAAFAQKLGEVVVTGQKALIEEKVDRTIYNAENDQTARGGDATDVLKRVPLLSVDLDGNVSLRGSSNIRVLINNKPSAIAASSIADALKQIPADQIKTVEVITSPSAKYDAEGSGGIINIITKQNTLSGGSLGVDASVGTRNANLGLNASYRTGKMGFTLNGGGRGQYNVPGSFINRQTIKDGYGKALSTTTQSADTRQNQGGGRATLGWDYDISKHNSLTASVTYGARLAHNNQNRLTTVSTSPQGNSVRDVSVVDNSRAVDASLNYTHTFEKPQQEFSVLTLYSRNDRTNDFTNNILNADFGTASRLRNENPSANEEFTIQADYQSPVGEKQVLEFGGKDIVRRVNSNYNYYQATGADGAYTVKSGAGLNNGFNYRQNVAASYVSYTLGLPKGFTLKPGLRYEYTSIAANFNDDKPVAIPDYGVLVPSANLSRKLTNGNVLKLAYNRRIQRPSLQFLNPNPQQSNPLIVTLGTPTLRPEYTNNYELGYSTLVKKANVNFSLFARNTTGSIQSVRTPVLDDFGMPTGVQSVRYENIGQEDAYGGSMFASINSGKFSLNGGLDTYYALLTNNVPNPFYNARNEGLVASGRLMGNYRFSDKWALQGFSFYRGRQVQLQGYQGGFGVYALSLRHDFAEKKGTIGFGASNFFTNSINVRSQVTSPLLDQASTNVLHTMSFQVNVSYRIGKLTAAQPRRARSINNDDLKGDGGGNDAGGDASGSGGAPAGGGGRPAGAGGARPAGAAGAQPAGARPGGYPGAPAGARPNAAPGTQPLTAPGGTTDSTKTQPGTVPPTAPGQARPLVQPTDSTGPRRPTAPLNAPVNPITLPANAPSPGTTAPGGITPAGSSGGRP